MKNALFLLVLSFTVQASSVVLKNRIQEKHVYERINLEKERSQLVENGDNAVRLQELISQIRAFCYSAFQRALAKAGVSDGAGVFGFAGFGDSAASVLLPLAHPVFQLPALPVSNAPSFVMLPGAPGGGGEPGGSSAISVHIPDASPLMDLSVSDLKKKTKELFSENDPENLFMHLNELVIKSQKSPDAAAAIVEYCTEYPDQMLRAADAGLLRLSALSGLLNLVQCFVELGADINKSSVAVAMQYKKYNVFNWLVSHSRFDPNAKNQNGDSLIVEALKYDNRLFMEPLMSHPDFKAPGEEYRTNELGSYFDTIGHLNEGKVYFPQEEEQRKEVFSNLVFLGRSSVVQGLFKQFPESVNQIDSESIFRSLDNYERALKNDWTILKARHLQTLEVLLKFVPRDATLEARLLAVPILRSLIEKLDIARDPQVLITRTNNAFENMELEYDRDLNRLTNIFFETQRFSFESHEHKIRFSLILEQEAAGVNIRTQILESLQTALRFKEDLKLVQQMLQSQQAEKRRALRVAQLEQVRTSEALSRLEILELQQNEAIAFEEMNSRSQELWNNYVASLEFQKLIHAQQKVKNRLIEEEESSRVIAQEVFSEELAQAIEPFALFLETMTFIQNEPAARVLLGCPLLYAAVWSNNRLYADQLLNDAHVEHGARFRGCTALAMAIDRDSSREMIELLLLDSSGNPRASAYDMLVTTCFHINGHRYFPTYLAVAYRKLDSLKKLLAIIGNLDIQPGSNLLNFTIGKHLLNFAQVQFERSRQSRAEPKNAKEKKAEKELCDLEQRIIKEIKRSI